MDLINRVRQYYLVHFDALPTDKQFHFASRLAAWEDLPAAWDKLQLLRHTMAPEGEIEKSLASLLHNPPEAKINAANTRQPYFEQYPELRPFMLALFRVRHLQEIYDIDARKITLKLVPYERLANIARQLTHDEEAISILSTYAVNYLYLLDHILFPDKQNSFLAVQQLYDIGKAMQSSEPEKIQLLIYLYTHCIIGESNFYVWPIRPQYKDIYQQMIEDLEELIGQHFHSINLDNKLEFLVCSRILGYTSKLESKIYNECAQSVSNEGTFLVDTFNNFTQSEKTSFSDSEHRNVLFIMSGSVYRHAA